MKKLGDLMGLGGPLGNLGGVLGNLGGVLGSIPAVRGEIQQEALQRTYDHLNKSITYTVSAGTGADYASCVITAEAMEENLWGLRQGQFKALDVTASLPHAPYQAQTTAAFGDLARMMGFAPEVVWEEDPDLLSFDDSPEWGEGDL